MAVAAGCGGANGPLPPLPAIVNVSMREYHYDYSTPIPRGRVFFQVRNNGRLFHRLALIPLPDDFPDIVTQLRGSDRRTVVTLAGIPAIGPGMTDSFAVDLAPGRYTMVDFGNGPDHKSFALSGMASEFRVS